MVEAAIIEPVEEKAPGYEFDAAFQRKIAALTLRDPVFLTRTDGLIKPEYFIEDIDASIVAMTLDFHGKYKKNPGISSIATMVKDAIAAKKVRKDLIPGVVKRIRELMRSDISDGKFVTDKVAEFARHRAMEEAVILSAEALEKKDYAKIEKLMKEAQAVGLRDDGGSYNYWREIENRTDHRAALKAGLIKADGITTGHKELDEVLYHQGWGRKELSVLMGAAKSGKSMSLAEFAKNASLAYFNVLYFTLEVSAQITADRIDANLSDTMMKVLKDTPNAVKAKIDAVSAGAGIFEIKEYASGTLKPSDIRRVIERYRDQGVIFDLVVIDYADIMAAEHYQDDHILNMRSIYLDVRGIGFTYNCAILTATQTNRNGAMSNVAKMTDIAEDFNKVRTADLLISINASEEEINTGEARLYFAAMRNSESGFTLRIKQDRSRMKFLIKVIGRE